MQKGTFKIKVGLAEMLKGGVIMDVTNVEQAVIAENAGAVAVMALEKIPADIRKDGGISRMSNPEMICNIRDKVSIPVMAKCRIGHFAEAQILEALEIDFIDESEVLTPADNSYHVDKNKFKVPFVCKVEVGLITQAFPSMSCLPYLLIHRVASVNLSNVKLVSYPVVYQCLLCIRSS